MTASPSPNLRGSLLMTLSMAGFAVEDMSVKAAARSLPVGEVLILIGLIGLVFFMTVAVLQGEKPLPRAFLGRTMILRSVFEVAGRLFYALALALIPLSAASAILQATPLVVVAGAALVFGETVGWRRWTAVAIGFSGVLLVLRPGVAGFDALALLAVAGMLGFAFRDLATRAAPRVLSNAQLGVAGFAMLTIAGIVILGVTGGAVWPDAARRGPRCRRCRLRHPRLWGPDRRDAHRRDLGGHALPLHAARLRPYPRLCGLRRTARRADADGLRRDRGERALHPGPLSEGRASLPDRAPLTAVSSRARWLPHRWP